MNAMKHITIGAMAVVLLAAQARATLTPVTGGDAGQGFAPQNTTFLALDLNNSSQTAITYPLTVQGVVFTGTSSPNFAMINDTPYATTPFGLTDQTSVNDQNLNAIVQGLVYQPGGNPLTLTISNLTQGKSYQVDLLLGVGGNSGARNQTFTFNGVQDGGPQFIDGGANKNAVYDESYTLTPNGSGKIVVVLGGGEGPVVNAIAITNFVLPEPSVALMFAMGGLMIWWKVRKVRA